MRSRMRAAIALFDCSGISSAPAAETRVTALVSTSKPASGRDTSLATIRSAALCLSFDCAYDTTSLVSAAKPTNTGTPCLRPDGQSVALGGNVRVGLEDSLFIGRGQLASSNAQQVTKIVRILAELGLEPASPEEARAALSLKGRDRTRING